jgi:hypothetical protein
VRIDRKTRRRRIIALRQAKDEGGIVHPTVHPELVEVWHGAERSPFDKLRVNGENHATYCMFFMS